jgi:uncharacterized protein (TIGR02266 family)
MPSSTGSGSPPTRGPRASSPRPSSRSPERSSESRPSFESRRDLPVPLPVALERRGAAETTVYATNLSASGVCVHLRRPLPVGDAVLLRFALPGEPGVLLARGRVSWCEEPPPAAGARFVEAGVRFEVLAEPDRERIARFVRSCDPALP